MDFRERIAGWAAQWLQGFQARHGLSLAPAELPVKIHTSGRTLLHVACGQSHMESIPGKGFREDDWQEIRLDADANVSPDIVGSMVDMSAVPDEFADALFSSHGIEHLYWHDVPRALAEFRRVLKPQGFAVITCPDIQAAAEMIALDKVFDTAYESPAGPITPFDIVFSYRPYVEQNPQWMSHHCGFTLSTLGKKLEEAGFTAIIGYRRPASFDLWVLACKTPMERGALIQLAQNYLPAQISADQLQDNANQSMD